MNAVTLAMALAVIITHGGEVSTVNVEADACHEMQCQLRSQSSCAKEEELRIAREKTYAKQCTYDNKSGLVTVCMSTGVMISATAFNPELHRNEVKDIRCAP